MSTPTLIAAAVLLVALTLAGVLVKSRAFGPLTSAGFLLGGLSVASGFVLFG